jgi:hypothetical protein
MLTTSVVDLDPGSVPPLQHNILLQLHEALTQILKQDRLFLFPFWRGAILTFLDLDPHCKSGLIRKRLLRHIALLNCIGATSVDSW